MARFYTSAVNGRGAGVKVIPVGVKGEPDRFEIYMTSGSHAAHRDVFIGTVTDTPDGPRFEPTAHFLPGETPADRKERIAR